MSFLTAATRYTSGPVVGYYLSPLLRGTHVFWDGGISRGCKVAEVPYSQGTPGIATGFWDSQRRPVRAYDSFLNQMPCIPLEGVLVEDGFAIFSCPPLNLICPKAEEWIASRPESFLQDFLYLQSLDPPITFEQELAVLRVSITSEGAAYLCRQVYLGPDEDAALKMVKMFLKQGPAILRKPSHEWCAGGSDNILSIESENKCAL